jgi:predicted nucleic acid-binding protein
MKKRFLDANVIVRFLLNDEKNQAKKAKDFFETTVKNKEKLVITPLVLAEVIYVLEKFGQASKEEISKILISFLNLPIIIVEEKKILLDALLLYSKLKINFVDCYHLSLCQTFGIEEIFSFDEDFKKASFVKSVSP